MVEIKITEEEISFSPEQLQRLDKLREERERFVKWNKANDDRHYTRSPSLKNGDPVYVKLKDVRFTGTIENVKGKNHGVIYDVNTPYGILKGLNYWQVFRRTLDESLKNVPVPEALSKLSAPHLVGLLKQTYKQSWDQNYNSTKGMAWHQGEWYSDYQIKAALIGKPHVPSKKERLRVKEHNSRTK
jgi:hypothetical protein